MNLKNLGRGVIDFKKKYCNENYIIADLIKHQIIDYFKEPILDIGAGMGDILINSIPDKQVTLLDKVDFSEFSIPDKYGRITKDFFQLKNSLLNYRTIFISHAMQFLDEDLNKLKYNISLLNIEYLILVSNRNDDILGQIIRLFQGQNLEINPEVEHDDFPAENFSLIKQIDFEAELKCDDFETLSKQIFYLLDYEPSGKNESQLIDLLCSELEIPQFQINQKVEVYKNENFMFK